MDVGPLRRHRDFRLLFIGQGLSFFGSMMAYVAIPYQAYRLSDSSLVARAALPTFRGYDVRANSPNRQ